MITQYLQANTMTLMILFALVMFMIVNRKNKIPAAHLFKIGAVLLLLLTFKDTGYQQFTSNPEKTAKIRTIIGVRIDDLLG